jgi:phosphatidylserine decarboxylase
MNKTMAYISRCLPQRLLTGFAGALARRKLGCFTRWLIKRFIAVHSVNMAEAVETDIRQFSTFNEFFTRQLKPGLRPFDTQTNVMISPADGACGEVGYIRHRQLLQAKGRYYSLSALLADKQHIVEKFHGGGFMTVYLSPKDYHRVHMPVSGKLVSMTFVPGKLFSVAPIIMQQVDAVFAQNERVICLFETAVGQVAVILVGAMIVGSMSMVWHGEVRSPERKVTHWDYSDQEVCFNKGDEIGQFQLGSTVIVLTQEEVIDSLMLNVGDNVLMGQSIASVHPMKT